MKASVVKQTILSAAVAVTATIASQSAEAEFRLRYSTPTDGAVITSNTGEINVNSTPIGTFTVTGIVADTSAGEGGALNVSGQISTTSAGTLSVFVQNTGFTSPTHGVLHAEVTGSLSGQTGSGASFNAFVNTMNLVPALGPDRGVGGAIVPVGANPAMATFAALAPAAFTVNGGGSPITTAGSGQVGFVNMVGPYSLFSQVVFTFTSAGIANFGIVAQTVQVPLPSTLLLALIGVPLIALARRRVAPAATSA